MRSWTSMTWDEGPESDMNSGGQSPKSPLPVSTELPTACPALSSATGKSPQETAKNNSTPEDEPTWSKSSHHHSSSFTKKSLGSMASSHWADTSPGANKETMQGMLGCLRTHSVQGDLPSPTPTLCTQQWLQVLRSSPARAQLKEESGQAGGLLTCSLRWAQPCPSLGAPCLLHHQGQN